MGGLSSISVELRRGYLLTFKLILEKHDILYSDYGTAFAEEWHQVFFHDPEGNIIEVHQSVLKS